MGLSMMAMGLFYARLPDGESAQVIASIGYSAGFLAVILARQQLFTENTLTAVLPVMTSPTWPTSAACCACGAWCCSATWPVPCWLPG